MIQSPSHSMCVQFYLAVWCIMCARKLFDEELHVVSNHSNACEVCDETGSWVLLCCKCSRPHVKVIACQRIFHKITMYKSKHTEYPQGAQVIHFLPPPYRMYNFSACDRVVGVAIPSPDTHTHTYCAYFLPTPLFTWPLLNLVRPEGILMCGFTQSSPICMLSNPVSPLSPALLSHRE